MLTLKVEDALKARKDWYNGLPLTYVKRGRTPVTTDCRKANDDGQCICFTDDKGRSIIVKGQGFETPEWRATKAPKPEARHYAHCAGVRTFRTQVIPAADDKRAPVKVNRIKVK